MGETEQNIMTLPVIDPTVRYVTRGQLRHIPLDHWDKFTYVVAEKGDPIAVAIPYETFLEMQHVAVRSPNRLEVVRSAE